MKRLIYILIIGLVVVLCSYSLLGSGEEVSKKVNEAICFGQSGVVAEHLAPEVSLVMQGAESTCSKMEVEQVLREFFKINKPAQFISTYSDGCYKGKLTTSDGKSFDLKYVIKNIDNKEVITGFYVN